MAKASSAEAGSTDMPVARLIDMSATPHTDTIVAIATAPGRGGVGVVRVSGPAATIIGERIAGALPAPRVAALQLVPGDLGLVAHIVPFAIIPIADPPIRLGLGGQWRL